MSDRLSDRLSVALRGVQRSTEWLWTRLWERVPRSGAIESERVIGRVELRRHEAHHTPLTLQDTQHLAL